MLPYLQAIIKETLRLYPVVQLSVSHEANRDCGISGYFIPKGTRVVLNLYKLQHDPRVWPNPSEFQPDRFLTTYKVLMSGDITSTSYLLGAGGGRALAIDMEKAIGLTNLKASPLEVLVSPRVLERVYRD
ncbi:hypothetical protein CDL15_Pgr006810 [Punica granatum]|uniref:Uncharacterized protein n=1 Tax=Punica granatum TaxID=22663 RepID=A0A218X7V7_PUNGR|nr:hypothetical protein CDL15_Pgr006810 [Punica granatum]